MKNFFKIISLGLSRYSEICSNYSSTNELFKWNIYYLITLSTLLFSISIFIITLLIYFPVMLIIFPLLICIKGIINKNWKYFFSFPFIVIGSLIYIFDWFNLDYINSSNFFTNYFYYSSLVIIGIVLITDFIIFIKVYSTIILGLITNIGLFLSLPYVPLYYAISDFNTYMNTKFEDIKKDGHFYVFGCWLLLFCVTFVGLFLLVCVSFLIYIGILYILSILFLCLLILYIYKEKDYCDGCNKFISIIIFLLFGGITAAAICLTVFDIYPHDEMFSYGIPADFFLTGTYLSAIVSLIFTSYYFFIPLTNLFERMFNNLKTFATSNSLEYYKKVKEGLMDFYYTNVKKESIIYKDKLLNFISFSIDLYIKVYLFLIFVFISILFIYILFPVALSFLIISLYVVYIHETDISYLLLSVITLLCFGIIFIFYYFDPIYINRFFSSKVFFSAIGYGGFILNGLSLLIMFTIMIYMIYYSNVDNDTSTEEEDKTKKIELNEKVVVEENKPVNPNDGNKVIVNDDIVIEIEENIEEEKICLPED